eukprot:CAMPEP_0184857584 /NCGR_PEP_ID=MMETSP0580-20130426/2736_1 /TAXON_ID=1118495 /ORGANISM="Dactyliosolen fragilissimus" /LENGTH=370 /DNA_ID=CAMNT_0027353263 /DNA_START=195 /DNA_END=1304 /DNA_ORIENTATION=-
MSDQVQQSEKSETTIQSDQNLSLSQQTKQRQDQDEEAHMESVSDAFRQYATFARSAREGIVPRIQSLPETQRKVLPPSLIPGTQEYREREETRREAELRNQFFFDCMLVYSGLPNSQQVLRERKVSWTTDEFFDKTCSVLKSIARDWSQDGRSERDSCYKPILEAIATYLPLKTDRDCFSPRICVPGAGAGRLALEICAMGYEVQGNEFSLFMLLASDFILNSGITPQQPYTICPWLVQTKNVCLSTDPVRTVPIPDVDPVQLLFRNDNHAPEFSMTAGEFVSIYNSPKEHHRWHCVASCFFLDTAPCVVEYLQVIHEMLLEGGLLINFGPLLYHWSGPTVRPDDLDEHTYRKKHHSLDKRYLESVDMSW